MIATNIGCDAESYVTISVPGTPANDVLSATISVRTRLSLEVPELLDYTLFWCPGQKGGNYAAASMVDSVHHEWVVWGQRSLPSAQSWRGYAAPCQSHRASRGLLVQHQQRGGHGACPFLS